MDLLVLVKIISFGEEIALQLTLDGSSFVHHMLNCGKISDLSQYIIVYRPKLIFRSPLAGWLVEVLIIFCTVVSKGKGMYPRNIIA